MSPSIGSLMRFLLRTPLRTKRRPSSSRFTSSGMYTLPPRPTLHRFFLDGISPSSLNRTSMCEVYHTTTNTAQGSYPQFTQIVVIVLPRYLLCDEIPHL